MQHFFTIKPYRFLGNKILITIYPEAEFQKTFSNGREKAWESIVQASLPTALYLLLNQIIN
jgi:hypothetical protein